MSQSLSSFTHPRAPILTLPLEITQQTLIYTTPSDVSSIAQTCRAFHEIIYSPKDTHIWKNLFLDIFDDPRIRTYVDRNGLKGVLRLGQQDWRREIGDVEYDWMKELQRRTGAQNLFQSKTRSINATCAHRKEVLKTFISIVQSALPYLPNTQDEKLNQESKNGKWLLDLLESKDALNYTVWPSLRRSLFTTMEQYPDKEELSLRNQLHTYLGLMEGDRRPNSHISPSSSPRSPDEPLEGLEETFINHSNLGANLGLSFGVQGSRSALARLPESSISEHLLGPGRNTSVYTAAFGPPKSLRTTARAFVYDLRNYSAFNNWGPFVSDPDVERRSGYIDTRRVTRTIRTTGQFSTNWRHLDALMIVIAWNVAKIDELNDSLWTRLRLVPPMGLDTLRPYGAPGVWGDEERLKVENMSEFGAQDWAGVEGKWRRVVCFCDYHDLMRYNVSRLSSLQLLGLTSQFSVFNIDL
ncbi:hypothetical protein FRC02_001917 [Tulasnella sp. 418]|nr:hypothetical protein FRC02_001917 [Tulasnella sp. 418]